MNKINVLFFATLRQAAGVRQVSIEIPETMKVQELKEMLWKQFPGLEAASRTVVTAINREFASDEDLIPAGAEVAFFPPVSGGSFPTVCIITEEEINLNNLLSQITLPTTGAACFFTGMVREVTTRDNPHQTLYLEYEAYQPMAESKMLQIAAEIRQRWNTVEGIALVQRIGRLAPGTPTVMIACTAPHRDTGVFEAARYGIDRLKEIVPVWKKEVSPEGETWVEGEYLPKSGGKE